MYVNNTLQPQLYDALELERIKAQITAADVNIEATEALLKDASQSGAKLSQLEVEVKKIESTYNQAFVIGALTTFVGAGYLAMKGFSLWQSAQTLKKG